LRIPVKVSVLVKFVLHDHLITTEPYCALCVLSSLYFNNVLNYRKDAAEKCVAQSEVDKNFETQVFLNIRYITFWAYFF
jgi:hypothetical protein